jgi:hypothetical protein
LAGNLVVLALAFRGDSENFSNHPINIFQFPAPEFKQMFNFWNLQFPGSPVHGAMGCSKKALN